MQRPLLTGALLAALHAVPAAGPVRAQAVLDWPPLLEARPLPLMTGAGAILGSPAGIVWLEERAEGLVSDLETPSALGFRAITVAGAVRLFDDWAVGAAYRHLGIGDMVRTGTDGPPTGPVTTPLEIGEDLFAVGLSARHGAFSAGAALDLATPSDELGGSEAWGGTLGAAFARRFAFAALELSAMLELGGPEPRLSAAGEFDSPALLGERLELGLAYGASRTGPLGVSHTFVATGTWRGAFQLQVGGAAQPGVVASEWVPVFGGLVRVGRYRLGIVREHLSSGFGAAMHYHLSVAF